MRQVNNIGNEEHRGMLQLELIRCFSPREQARAIAKASLPFPTPSSSSSSLLLPSQGSSRQDLGSHKIPDTGKQPMVVIDVQGPKEHTGMSYTAQGEGSYC